MIPLYCSFIRRKDMDTVLGCLVTDSVGPGEYGEKFLKNAKEAFGYEASIALRSPYLALLLALRQLGLREGAKIALSPLAPLYHLSAARELGLSPFFMDYDAQSGLPDLSGLKEAGCAAVLLFEAFGMLPAKEELDALGLPLVEDMSQALGAFRDEARAGALGNLVLYSLEQGSPVTAGGGALLFASTKRDAPIVRSIGESLLKELALTDYNAALGFAQLKDLSSSLQKRRDLEEVFRAELARSRHKTFRQPQEGQGGCYAFPVALETGMRDAIVYAKKNGIEAAPAFEQSIVAAEDFPAGECPGARSLAARCLFFPLHEKISAKDADVIGKVLATLP